MFPLPISKFGACPYGSNSTPTTSLDEFECSPKTWSYSCPSVSPCFPQYGHTNAYEAAWSYCKDSPP